MLRLTQKHVYALCFEIEKNWLFNLGNDILISALITI